MSLRLSFKICFYNQSFTGYESTLLLAMIALSPMIVIVSATYVGMTLGHIVGWIKGKDASLIN